MTTKTVNDIYLPPEKRTIDTQYRQNLQFILENGEDIADTPQDVPARTYLHPTSMRFPLKNGAPLITERAIPFWRSAVGEILGFINGVRENDVLKSEFGCPWWDAWVTEKKCGKINVPTGNMGPGAYGGAFHDFPSPSGKFNQVEHVVEQLRKYPHIRTHHITPWIPFWIGRGGFQKAVVSPCHGWQFYRVINGKLSLMMVQRSADFPVGVPANMIQYAALLLAVAHVTGYTPHEFIHCFFDAHIYTNQIESISEMNSRIAKKLPTLTLTDDGLGIENIFDFRPKHFTIADYDPHPGIKGIPVAV
jgi:thymidylate synthase